MSVTHVHIGGYRIVRRLGVGGVGEVFLARQESAAGLGRAVVIKVLKDKHAADREATARFLDEARLALQLRHRNICGVINVGQAEGRTFLVMDYVAGRDLRDVLRRLESIGRRMAPPLALYILKEILQALDYAHRMVDPRTGAPLGLVHRDVSPSNVMISIEGEVQLIDFGTAVSSWRVERTAAGQILGKVRYMSPEQARGDVVDARSDVYAAAVVGAELFSGLPYREPMGDRELLEITQRGEHSPLLDLLDDDLRALLERALSPDRAARVRTAGELVRACEELLVARREVVGVADIRAMMRELFPDELSRQRELFAEVLADGDDIRRDATGEVIFSRLDAVANAPAPSREVTQIVRVRGTVTQSDSAVVSDEITRIDDGSGVGGPATTKTPLVSSTTERTAIRRTIRPLAIAASIVAIAVAVLALLVASVARKDATATMSSMGDAGVVAVASDAGAHAMDGGDGASVAVADADADAHADAHADADADADANGDADTDADAVAGADDDVDADDDANADAGRVKRRVVKRTVPAPQPPVASMTLQQKLAALKSCETRKPCARTLLARGAARKTADETRLFLAEVDRCVLQCRR